MVNKELKSCVHESFVGNHLPSFIFKISTDNYRPLALANALRLKKFEA